MKILDEREMQKTTVTRKKQKTKTERSKRNRSSVQQVQFY